MSEITIGGQAVIEGVMMRSPGRVATACRTADGRIVIQSSAYISLTRRFKVLGLPIVRGMIGFVEMMVIGINTLNYSADVAMKDAAASEAAAKAKLAKDSGAPESAPAESANAKKSGSTTLALVISTVVAMAVGVGVFFFAPLAICNAIGIAQNALLFNIVAGGIRITIFIAYIWALTFSKEFQRVFEYHGAEHKTITAWENKAEMAPHIIATFTRFHPRCGTSFILIVALFAMIAFAVSDTLFAIASGAAPGLLQRFVLHMALLPLVAGSSFELLRLSAKTQDHALTKALIQPGLWLQRITTREPNHEQIAVAVVALQDALGIGILSPTSVVAPMEIAGR